MRAPAIVTLARCGRWLMPLTLAFILGQNAAGAEPLAPAPMYCKPPPLVASGSAEDFPPPPAHNRGFDVQTYDLDFRLDPGARSIAGTVIITLKATEDVPDGQLDIVQLDLVPELAVTAVADEQGPLVFSHQASVLEITLRQAIPAAATATVHISWQGQPPRHGITRTGLMFRHHDPAATPFDDTDDIPIIANQSETWSAHSWWPCKDHPADKARVSLAVTVPDTLSAVSNGTLLAVTTPEPGWHRYAWQEQYPLPTYLVSVAVSNYESWSEDCQPDVGPAMRLDYHVFPEDRAKAEVDFAPTCEMMHFLTDLLGPWPYPGEKYAQVEFKWFGAMEHTTATSIGQTLLTGDGRFAGIILHEMAHQWFGDSLTPAVWGDIWLNEGFARYTEALWAEFSEGPAAYDELMMRIGPDRYAELFRGDGVLSDPYPILPNSLVYDKGAWVLHMLRNLIGNADFFTFLRTYASAPHLAHGLVTTAEMIAMAEAAAGRPLGEFFAPWLETDLVPVISHKVFPGLGQAVLEITQHQQPVFQIPVPVTLHTTCGDVVTKVLLTEAKQTFTWDLDCKLKAVSLAPDGLALLRTTESLPPPLQVSGPAPNPVGDEGTQFMLFLRDDTEVTATVYNARGHKLYEENLGLIPGREMEGLPVAPGHPWQWLPNRAGQPSLASGVYYVEFRGGGGRQVRPVTVVR